MLTAQSALLKDRRNARAPALQHRHFAVIAGIVACLPPHQRKDIAERFAYELTGTNPKFNRSRFMAACNC